MLISGLSREVAVLHRSSIAYSATNVQNIWASQFFNSHSCKTRRVMLWFLFLAKHGMETAKHMYSQ